MTITDILLAALIICEICRIIIPVIRNKAPEIERLKEMNEKLNNQLEEGLCLLEAMDQRGVRGNSDNELRLIKELEERKKLEIELIERIDKLEGRTKEDWDRWKEGLPRKYLQKKSE